MIFWISLLLESSSPARLSLESRLVCRLKVDEERPASMSELNEDGSREYIYEEPGTVKGSSGRSGSQRERVRMSMVARPNRAKTVE